MNSAVHSYLILEIRHQRRGEVYPASTLEKSITAAFLAPQARLEAQQREARSDPRQVLSRIVADGEVVG